MKKTIPSRTVIDWVRIVIPYPFDEVSEDEFCFESVHHNPVKAGLPKPEAFNLVQDFLNVLGIDGENKTDLSLFQHKDNAKPYDTRYIRDGFDLLFNDLGTPAWENVEVTNDKGYMPVRRLEMGLKLDIQGRGCRYIEHTLARDGHSWHWLFLKLRSMYPDIRVRRIDVAYDIFKHAKRFTPQYIGHRFERERKYREQLKKLDDKTRKKTPDHKYVKTRRHKFKLIHSGDVSSGDVTGDTFYLGQGSDEVMLRIYDKDAERVYAHGDTWRRGGKERHYWYRWEVQTQGGVAMKVFNRIADGENGGAIWLNLIRRMFCILPSKQDKLKKRTVLIPYKEIIDDDLQVKPVMLETPCWWADFVQHSAIDEMDFSTVTKRSDIESSERWSDGPVAHTVFMRLTRQVLLGGDAKQLLEHWIQQGNKQLNSSDIKKLRAQINFLEGRKQAKMQQSGEEEKRWIEDVENYFGEQLQDKMDEERKYQIRKDIAKMQAQIPDYKPFDLEHYFEWFDGVKDTSVDIDWTKGKDVIK